MATAKDLSPDMCARFLDALLQLHHEGDGAAIVSMLCGLDECPPEMVSMLGGMLDLAEATPQG